MDVVIPDGAAGGREDNVFRAQFAATHVRV